MDRAPVYRTKQDIFEALKKQVNFLVRSCNAYDDGFEDEAIHLATSLRVLIHDSGNCTSILKQLGKKNMLVYSSGHQYNPRNVAPQLLLCCIRTDASLGIRYIPRLSDWKIQKSKDKILLEEWWKEIVFSDSSHKVTLTRENICRTVADKEGGTHFDPTISTEYAELIRGNLLGWKIIIKEEKKPGRMFDFASRIDFPSIRQIAHELLVSLNEEYPKIVEGYDFNKKMCQIK